MNAYKIKAFLKRIVSTIAPYGSRRYQLLWKIVLWSKALSPFNRKYRQWMERFDLPSSVQAENIIRLIGAHPERPLFSIIMPVYDPPPEFLHEAIQSVLAQTYPHWELCIADDASPNPVIKSIIEAYAKEDPRIKYIFREQNGHISAASNSALTLATGDYIALLDHDDTLHPFALSAASRGIDEHPDCEILYSDEDKLTWNGKRLDPYFKPDFDYELLLNHNYLIHLGVYKLSSVRKIGGFRLGFEGSQDYDLILRLIDQTDHQKILHIPQILYHWRMSMKSAAQNVNVKPYAVNSSINAIEDHFERNKIHGTVEFIPHLAVYRPHYQIPEPKTAVEIFLLARGSTQNTIQRVKLLHAKTEYMPSHLTIVFNQEREAEQDASYHDITQDTKGSIIAYDKPRHLPKVINEQIEKTEAEFICLVGEHVLDFTTGWLGKLMAQATQEGIGVVGPKLVTQQGKVASNGIILGCNGLAVNLFQNQPVDDPGYLYWAALQRGYSVLSSECLLISKETLLKVKGMDPSFIIPQYRVVDVCLKLRSNHFRNILVPTATLLVNALESDSHFNDDSSPEIIEHERNRIEDSWQRWIELDPAFNPNLLIENGSITINLSPRKTPWNQ